VLMNAVFDSEVFICPPDACRYKSGEEVLRVYRMDYSGPEVLSCLLILVVVGAGIFVLSLVSFVRN
jgi:hypothetical protein